MRFTRATVATAALTVATAGTALVPFAASAQTAPVTNLQGSLLSAAAPGTTGIVAYHASMLSTAREFKVQLKNVPSQSTSEISIYVQGSLVTSAPLSSAGGATIDLRSNVPAMKSGEVVQVRTGNGTSTAAKVLCTGVLRVSPTNGSHVPTRGR